MPSGPSKQPRARKLIGWGLVAYWVALFIGTHLPPTGTVHAPHHFDKLLHFGAFGGLGFLAGLWLAARGQANRRTYRIAFAVLAAYGVLDELTQIPVGRQFEFLDIAADWLGAACGLAAAAVVTRRWSGRLVPQDEPRERK